MLRRFKICVWGNTVFTEKVLRTLHESDQFHVSVVTGDSNQNPVADYAKQNNIKILNFEKLDENSFLEFSKDLPDINIVIAYGKIIPQSFLDSSLFMNIHGSLLPDLRGATPIQTALLHGYNKTGVTIQKMAAKMDAGEILRQYDIGVDIQDNFETLRDKMTNAVSQDLVKFINDYHTNRKIVPITQDENKVTTCKISDFKREKGELDWDESIINIHDKIRAFFPEPLAWTKYEEKILNIHSSTPTDFPATYEAATMFSREKRLYISCRDFDLEITSLVLQGKKKMSGRDFANGYIKDKKIKLG